MKALLSAATIILIAVGVLVFSSLGYTQGWCSANTDCAIEGSSCGLGENYCEAGYEPRITSWGGPFACTDRCNCCPTSQYCGCECVQSQEVPNPCAGEYCGNGNCNTGCDESSSSCPQDCDSCYGVSCNSPPGPYCSGSTRVYYNSPGSCSGGSCSYSTSSEQCTAPSPDCSGSSRCTYDAYCSGGSCGSSRSCSQCPTPGNDCYDGDTRRTYSAYCSGGSCGSSASYTDCTAPGPDCYDGDTRRTYSGYCSGGNCGTSSSLQDCTAPGSTCIGNTRRTYSAYCSGSSCGTSSSDTNCPTSGCNGNWRQSGGCSGGSCYLNNAEDCGGNYWGCQDSETKALRNRGCSGGSCYGYWSNQENCNNNNYCSNSGSPYNVCRDSSTVVTRQDRVLNDYGCSGGSCTVASSYSSGSCPPVDSNPQTCNPSSPTCSGTSRCTYSAGCSGGSCYNTPSCSPCPTPGPDCYDGDTRRTYSPTCSGGNCGTTQSLEDCPTPSPTCVNAGTRRVYAAACSGAGSCGSTYTDVACPSGTTCSGGSCVACNCPTPSPTCADSDTKRTYTATCPGGTCSSTYTDSDCPTPSPDCSGSSRCTYTATCTGSGVCGSTQGCSQCPTPSTTCVGTSVRTYSPTCSGGNCGSTYSDTQCPTPSPTCADGDTRRTYSPTCSGGGTCGSTATDTDCPTASPTCVDGDTRRTYTATCSGGNCGNAPTDTDCPTPSPTCVDGDTRRTYSPTCSGAGNCGTTQTDTDCTAPPPTCMNSNTRRSYTPVCSGGGCATTSTDTDCQYGCSGGQCASNPCSPNPCNSAPDDICVNSNTLNVYPSTGACTPGINTYSCNYAPSQTSCTYGCVSLSGDDQCAPNTAPTLSSLSLSATYGSYAKSGQSATVSSSGSDPNGEQVRLRCGSSSGGTDLCTSSYVSSGPSCPFTSGWTDSADHNIYCFLQDSAGAISSVLTATLSADNSGPSVSITRSPTGAITPGTSVTLTASASDSRSGVATTSITVDGLTANMCSSATCSYTFTPAYGSHTVSSSSTDRVGNSGQSPSDTFTVNNPPTVQPITYSGACKEGGTITLKCSASDANQQSSTLSARVWAGECNGNNCFATRSWATGQGTTYANGAAMTYQSGDTFTRDITINQGTDGKGIAATCQATDELSAASNWGDAYPLCVVNQCQNPPVVTVESITPDPSGPGDIQVAFRTDRAAQGDPAVKVKPGSQRGGTSQITASQVSKNGNTYVYKFTVQASALSGIADVSVGGGWVDDKGINCQFSQISQMTIDTDAPTTTILCNGAACTSNIYVGPVTMVMNCADNTTSCSSTKFGVGPSATPSEEYSVPRVIDPQRTGLNTVTVRYQSTDAVGNAEQVKTQNINIYLPPCKNPAEEPTCLGGRIEEEVKIKVVLAKTSVLRGDTLDSRIYCFVRNKETKVKTRECILDATTLKITVDRGTAQQKDYFRWYYPGYNYPYNSPTPYDSSRIIAYLNERQDTTSRTQAVDNIQYTFSKHWKLPIYTSVFHSEVCVEGQDQQSGLGGENCENYQVTDSEIVMDVGFLDLGVIVPRTTDGSNEANFTKGMLVNFAAAPTVRTTFTSSPCTDINCDVDFNFDSGVWKQTTWSDFEKAYIPQPLDVASNGLGCDSYHTLNVKAVKVTQPDAGIEMTVQKSFFISCEPRIIVVPAEVRLVLNDQPGKVFEVMAFNPTDSEKTFELSATTSDPNSFPLPWIMFECDSIGCEAGPGPGLPNDDYARLTVPSGLSRSVLVMMSTAAKSGQYPVTFVATEGTNTYTAVGTLLIFAEGLDEFAAWQLAGLVLIVLVILYYFGFGSDATVSKTRRERKRRK